MCPQVPQELIFYTFPLLSQLLQITSLPVKLHQITVEIPVTVLSDMSHTPYQQVHKSVPSTANCHTTTRQISNKYL